MMRIGLLAAVVICGLLGALAVADEAPRSTASVDDLAWLAGCWAEVEDGQRTEECWLAPRGGMMLGLNRTARDDGRSAFEFLRIAADGDGVVTYFASPGGKPAKGFRLTSHGSRQAVFEDPEHDFPQRLVYRLDDEGVLHVRVEAEAGGEVRGFDLTLSPAEFP
ncbi:MAG: DUF6265 family protein [Thermoanaerobaculia bacterium]